MKKIFKTFMNLIRFLGRLFIWLLPLSLFLIATYAPKMIWTLTFPAYLKFLGILIWPTTILIILFFFRKVVTYLFFSMDEFNFFGAKGNLRNINEVILEEVNKKFLEGYEEKKRNKEMEKLNEKIKQREVELHAAKGDVEHNLQFARDILSEWKKSSEESKNSILHLIEENKRLKELISSVMPINSGLSLVSNDGDTSDSISEEDSTNNSK